MNVFKVKGGDVTSINAQLIRLAGGCDTLVIESELVTEELEFARHVATLIAESTNCQVREISAFGYELGLAAKQRNLKYRIFCLDNN
jgi:hypothetical protein